MRFLGAVLLTLSAPALAQDAAPAWMVVGTELVYDVDYQGSQYQFLVTLEDVGEDLAFSWEMTEPVGTAGMVTLSAAAREGARAQHNELSGGDLALTEATSVWLSQAVYGELKAGTDALVVLDGEEVTLHPAEADPYPVGIMEEDLALIPLYAQSDEGAHEYWVLDDPTCPLILKMDLGWSIRLSTIRPGKTVAQKRAEQRARLLASFMPAPTDEGGKLCRKAVKKAGKADPRTYKRTDGGMELVSNEVVTAQSTGKDELTTTTALTFADGRQITGVERLQCHGEQLWLTSSYYADDGTPITLNPPMAWLPLALEAGAQWTWRGLWSFGEEEAVMEAAFSVGDPMEVTVPAGTFQVLPIEWALTTDDGEYVTRDWVIPGRIDGLVRRETDQEILELVE